MGGVVGGFLGGVDEPFQFVQTFPQFHAGRFKAEQQFVDSLRFLALLATDLLIALGFESVFGFQVDRPSQSPAVLWDRAGDASR